MISDEELKGLMKWGYKIANKFAASYGDTVGSFEASVASGLTRAWKTYDSDRGPFDQHAKHVIKQEMQETMRRSGPLGFRRDQRIENNHIGQPSISQMSMIDDREGPSFSGQSLPVGWEIEYHDWVEGLAKKVPKNHSDLLRVIYLHCVGESITGAANKIGVSRSRASEMHSSAIQSIRKRLGVTNA